LIYVDPEADVGLPYWVADGRALVAQKYESNQALVIYRDGQVDEISYAGQSRFINGTTTGWLLIEIELLEFRHYVIEADGSISVDMQIELPHPLEHRIDVLHRPYMGESISELTFSPVEQYSREVAACPDTSPTRLQGVASGRVVAGTVIDLHAMPDLSSEQTGQLSDLREFDIVYGPVCADSMRWWLVEAEEFTGWTSEGDADGYWLEPID
jgi:hypothetical protein